MTCIALSRGTVISITVIGITLDWSRNRTGSQNRVGTPDGSLWASILHHDPPPAATDTTETLFYGPQDAMRCAE